MHLILGFLGFAIYTEFVCGMTILVMKYQYHSISIRIQDGVPARNFTLAYETSLLKHRDDGRFGIRVFGQLLGHF